MTRLFAFLKHSLQVRLISALVLLVLLLAAVAGGFSFYDTYREAEELQDELLQQTALHINPVAPVTPPKSENDTEIYVQLPNQADKTVEIPPHLSDGLHTLPALNDDDGDLYRVYLHTTPQGVIAVMQEIEYRESLATRSAWASVLPILLALPLIIVITIGIIYRTLQPVKTMSQELESRQNNDLSPLGVENIPSEIKGFVNAINRLLARTDENIRQQQRFIADAAHELRSPMTALSLQAERLNNMNLPQAAHEQSQQLQQSISRNRHLLEQLLSLARAQSPDTPRPASRISLQNQFRRVLQELMPLAMVKQQDIGVAVENDCEIYADDTEIYTLIKTLADNAVRYTPPDGRIDLGFCETDTALVLWVEDNGHGIPEAERERVLDPFYRILGSGQQGTGLGLSIADTIAKRYGGKLVLQDSTQFAGGLLIEAHLDKDMLQVPEQNHHTI